MKFQKATLTLLLALFSFTAYAQQSTQSDYAIQKEFKKQYENYKTKIEKVSSTENMQALIDSIKVFEEEYSQYDELLNKALYPETYSNKMDELKESSVMAKKRLNTIEQQTQKLEELETQLASYEENLDNLDQRTDSLKQALQKSVQSESELSSMLREYRQNLQKRDDLILAFIDSMIVTYQEMDLQALQDLENIESKGARLDSDGNALAMIRNISAENLNILEENADKLRLEDFMRMAQVQQQFEKMWSRLGDKIQEVYSGENPEKLASDIDQNIDQWNKKLRTRIFASLRDSLAENEINVEGFATSEEFYNSINSYLDRKIKQSKENQSEEEYTNYKKFQQFWNQMELQWSESLVDASIVSKGQMATISQKVNTWSENAQPRSNNFLVYLLGASVLLAVALGVMLIREKKNNG